MSTYPHVHYPLKTDKRYGTILFIPGEGVGLGDQFLLLPLIQALQYRFPSSEVVLLTDHVDFWKLKTDCFRGKFYSLTRNTFTNCQFRLCEKDLLLAGHIPNYLDLLRHTGDTVFSEGTDLATYTAYFRTGDLQSRIALAALASVSHEEERFKALFVDAGIISDEEMKVYSAFSPTVVLVSSSRPPSILIHPTTAEPQKNWPIQFWSVLVAKLSASGATVSVSAGRTVSDSFVARKIVDACPSATLLPQMPLGDFLSCLRLNDFVVAGDTFVQHAVAHFANAVSISLYRTTDPLRYCPCSPNCFYLGPDGLTPNDAYDAVQSAIALVGRDCVASPKLYAEYERFEKALTSYNYAAALRAFETMTSFIATRDQTLYFGGPDTALVPRLIGQRSLNFDRFNTTAPGRFLHRYLNQIELH